MNPWQLAKDSESSHQIALFCFVAKAQNIGFTYAKKEAFWKHGVTNPIDDAVPELRWFHHIPNGGSRGDSSRSRAIAGGQLKAEGVKSGVMDCFWPLKRGSFCGLYIEMKRPAEREKKGGGLSDSQKEFGDFVHAQDYFVQVCYSWLDAADTLEWYYNLKD